MGRKYLKFIIILINNFEIQILLDKIKIERRKVKKFWFILSIYIS
jgi:hypothetical protein